MRPSRIDFKKGGQDFIDTNRESDSGTVNPFKPFSAIRPGFGIFTVILKEMGLENLIIIKGQKK
ncbi:MAG: hypothetical protein JW765_08820 [Deltaproteobacteria bacterium]|nr:hypothetical protein [Candidatus Zymogenaceae bacterium]